MERVSVSLVVKLNQLTPTVLVNRHRVSQRWRDTDLQVIDFLISKLPVIQHLQRVVMLIHSAAFVLVPAPMKRSIAAARYVLVNRQQLFMCVFFLPFLFFTFFFLFEIHLKVHSVVEQHQRRRCGARRDAKLAEILICVSADLRQKVGCDDSGSVSERKCFAVFPSFQARRLLRNE